MKKILPENLIPKEVLKETRRMCHRKNALVGFGKYRDKTWRWVIKNAPKYILWLKDKRICEIPAEWEIESASNEQIRWLEEESFYWDLMSF